MSLIASNALPTLTRLKKEGGQVYSAAQAAQNGERLLEIGLLNIMPDAALEATERQFMRLVGGGDIAVRIHLFTLPELERGREAQAHVAAHYESFEHVKSVGLDALIISGANVEGSSLAKQPFWRPLSEVIDWATAEIPSTLCSCLATHAVLHDRYGQARVALPGKRWGVFTHQVVEAGHALVASLPAQFEVPHSRFNEVTAEQFTEAGVQVLVASESGEVHLAVSDEESRFVFFQGHPEYDAVSLMKEYNREVSRFSADEISEYPPIPDNYFTGEAQTVLVAHKLELEKAKMGIVQPPAFPEAQLAAGLMNSWRQPAQQVFDNWLNLLQDDRYR